jgi:hypothetical protein
LTNSRSFLAAAQALQPDTIKLRRAIHEEPELGLDTPKTLEKVKAALTGLPLTFKEARSCTGVIAILDGAALTLPNGLAGGLPNVTFMADFTCDTPGVTVNWQWGCAVYRSFSADYGALGVKPVDASSGNQYHNLDRAGTPENFKSFVAAGATGNGGMNYTGSYSSTGHAATSPWVPPPPPSNGTASISGTVFQDINFNGVQDFDEVGMEGVELDLTGVDVNGNTISLVTYTDANGHYSFTGLLAGTYRLFEVQPEHYLDGGDSVGSVNGESRGTKDGQDMIGEIVLHDGDQAMGYNFAEIFDSND